MKQRENETAERSDNGILPLGILDQALTREADCHERQPPCRRACGEIALGCFKATLTGKGRSPRRRLRLAYTLNGSQVTQTDLTNPRGYLRRLTFNADRFLTSDVEEVVDALCAYAARTESGWRHAFFVKRFDVRNTVARRWYWSWAVLMVMLGVLAAILFL